MNQILDELSKMVELLKSKQRPDENPLQTISRLIGSETQPQPQPQPQRYKFKTITEMQIPMNNAYGANWQSIISPNPMALQSVAGSIPENEKSQQEMDRIYKSGDDRAIGSIQSAGNNIIFNRLMIEPVSQ